MEQTRSAPEDLTGLLSFTLLDRRSSVPLHGARINCIGRDNRVMRYDADRSGRFTTKLPQGAYDLVISARGYLSLLVRGVGVLAGHHQAVTRALIPGDGDDPQGEPATAIGGFITDRFGRSVEGVNIKLKAESDEAAAYTTRSERDGAYLFHSVIPANYVLQITAGNRRLVRDELAVANPRDFIRRDLRLLQA